MAVFYMSCAGRKVMLDAIGQVIEDPSFKIPTAEATEARDDALNLSAWRRVYTRNSILIVTSKLLFIIIIVCICSCIVTHFMIIYYYL